MSVRVPLDPKKFGDVIGGMIGLNRIIESSGLEEARLGGETEQRIYLLNAGREALIYSPRARTALAWAEAVTRLEKGEVPDDVYQQAREHFDEQQLMKLTLQVVAINGWNRFCISFNATPGTYVPGSLRKTGIAQASTSH